MAREVGFEPTTYGSLSIFNSFAVGVLNLYIYYIRNFKKNQIFLARVVRLKLTAWRSQSARSVNWTTPGYVSRYLKSNGLTW